MLMLMLMLPRAGAGGWKLLTVDTESAGVNEDVDEIVEAIPTPRF
jgi:hypothetical protein